MNRREFAFSATLLGTSLLAPRTEATTQHASLVSLVRVIANPAPFDGKRVRLAGFLDYNGFDKSIGIYISEPDGRNFISPNSIYIEEKSAILEKLVQNYVTLEATYHAPKGFMSEYQNGFLDQLTDLTRWQSGDKDK